MLGRTVDLIPVHCKHFVVGPQFAVIDRWFFMALVVIWFS
jgi:hypothetical protein